LTGNITSDPADIDKSKPFSFHAANIVMPDSIEKMGNKLSHGVDVKIEYSINEIMRRLIVAVELWDSTGICILTSMDMDQKEVPYAKKRIPGKYSATCHIPGIYLRPGRYYVTIGAAVPTVKRLDVIPRQLSFDVLDVEKLSDRVGQGRKGLIAPPLKWKTQKQI